ncbi:MAG: hypothetical protein JJW01_03350 [Alphaproteobacteria bacterium]|nr:hypothetical protein [Rickettsiales bacterium]
MLKKIIFVSVIASGAIYGIKNKDTIKRMLSGSKNISLTTVNNISPITVAEIEKEIKPLLNQSDSLLSPYQKCIKEQLQKLRDVDGESVNSAINRCAFLKQ